MGGNDDIFTWFPRREDYEIAPAFVPDETVGEKVARLNETIEANQINIKEVVDGVNVPLEHKIYRTMDLTQDMEDMAHLLKECEGMEGIDKLQAELKKAKIGIMNLKAYMSQVDNLEFATAIRNEQQFKVINKFVIFALFLVFHLQVGCQQGFGPWLDWAEKAIENEMKPTSFDHGVE